MNSFRIGSREIGKGHPTFIIAELSANHNNDYDTAVKTIEAMAEAGADAVKIQTYTADTITMDGEQDFFKTRKESLGGGRSYYSLYQEASLPWEWQGKLMELTQGLGMEFFSSPFDRSAVDFLEDLSVPAYKIASLEITDIPLIKYVATKGKPVIISTGIASEEDVALAVSTCRDAGNDQIALLRCTSAYPTPAEEMNLNSLTSLQADFGEGMITGLSDHTMSVTAPTASVALGGNIVEKHFILDREMGGVDSSFSLNKEEFKEMVNAVRETEAMLGDAQLEITEKMELARRSARSLFVVEDIKAGEEFTAENVRSIRPNQGLHPKHMEEVLGKTSKADLKRGTPLSWDHIS